MPVHDNTLCVLIDSSGELYRPAKKLCLLCIYTCMCEGLCVVLGMFPADTAALHGSLEYMYKAALNLCTCESCDVLVLAGNWKVQKYTQSLQHGML